ncbi:MAG: hypothetical protein QGG36_25690 [Pirellulaceae bacterium]|jgi:TM2 domain-containing membrane protein YozV|nr:hypothetical protein [Pirellulaceae bacterium]MDP7019216.1 hypothetical protein [Pirellulaceae bacterium]
MSNPDRSDSEVIEIDLRNPAVAALWAWLIPGAGHFYQRRIGKGLVFMICVLSTYFFGFTLGGGKVVYASFRSKDLRWQYVCQVGVGAAALPAMVQSYRVKNNRPPLMDGFMAPPIKPEPEYKDELAEWHEEYHVFFELGTLYTMVAGLLNVLAIYDAYAGPMIISDEEETREKPPPGD